MRVRALPTTFLLSLLVGCSPYIYKTETAGFAAGVEQLKKAQEAAIAGLVSDRETDLRNSAVAARTTLTPSPDCTNKTSPPPPTVKLVGACTLTGRAPGTTPDDLRESIAVEQQAMPALGWLKVLTDYGAALAAITDATDRAALVDAQGKLAAAAKAVAKQRDDAVIARAKAGDAEAAAKPLIADGVAAGVSLISLAFNAILDRQRLVALERAVRLTDEPVQVLAGYIGEVQTIIKDTRRAGLTDYASRQTRTAGSATKPDIYQADFDKAFAATKGVDALIGANPQQAADKMAKAHHDLFVAVTSRRGQSLVAIESITEFVAAATAVRDGFAKTAAEAASGS